MRPTGDDLIAELHRVALERPRPIVLKCGSGANQTAPQRLNGHATMSDGTGPAAELTLRDRSPQNAQQEPVAKKPQGTSAFAAGLNDGVSSVVESGLIVMVSPAPPLLTNELVE